MKWYRSLYFRIALGGVALLAAMLFVQAVLFTWAVSQSGRSLPGQSPMRFGQTIALDLAALLDRDPQADLGQYVHEQYAQYNHPFFVVLADGRVISSGSTAIAEPLLAMARAQLSRWRERPPMRWFERGDGQRFGRPTARRRRAAVDRRRSSAAASGSNAGRAACRSSARCRSSSAGAWPAWSSCRRRRRSDSCSDALRRCSRSSPAAS